MDETLVLTKIKKEQLQEGGGWGKGMKVDCLKPRKGIKGGGLG